MSTTSYILFTGGRESLINLHLETLRLHRSKKTSGASITLVLFDYGQKSFPAELRAARYYQQRYKFVGRIMERRIQMEIPDGIRTGQGESDHVVARNLLFISHLVNHIGSVEKARILIGTVQWRKKAYHDGLKGFRTDLHNLLHKLYPNITLTSHTDQFYGVETYEYLVAHNIDCYRMWICMDNGERPCGKCKKCRVLEKEIFSLTENKMAQQFKKIYYGN